MLTKIYHKEGFFKTSNAKNSLKLISICLYSDLYRFFMLQGINCDHSTSLMKMSHIISDDFFFLEGGGAFQYPFTKKKSFDKVSHFKLPIMF